MKGYKKIGEKIKFYRKQKGFSGIEFAKLCHISSLTLKQIENGEIVYDMETLEVFANILDIPLPCLLDFEN